MRMMNHALPKHLGIAVPMMCAVLLFGCTGSWSLREEQAGESVRTDARTHRLLVPFFPDDTDQCGPATLASVMSFWGVPTNPQLLKQQVYLPKLKGSLPIDLLLAAQAHGLHAESFRGSLEGVKAELEAGHPLVAFLNLGYEFFPQGHYVVIIGYDDAHQGVYVHSGLDRDEFLPYPRFLRGWDKTGRWMLKILPASDPQKVHS